MLDTRRNITCCITQSERMYQISKTIVFTLILCARGVCERSFANIPDSSLKPTMQAELLSFCSQDLQQ